MIRIGMPIAVLAAIAICLAAAGPAEAQWPNRGGAPSIFGPGYSPWFDLYRSDGGPLPNYYQFVRPRQKLQRTIRQGYYNMQSQQAQIRTLNREITGLQQPGAALPPTGTGSVFMNYSHYYPRSAGGGGGGSSPSWSPGTPRSGGYGGY